jgi:hypothetical protein
VYSERGVPLPVLTSGGECVGVRACKNATRVPPSLCDVTQRERERERERWVVFGAFVIYQRSQPSKKGRKEPNRDPDILNFLQDTRFRKIQKYYINISFDIQ